MNDSNHISSSNNNNNSSSCLITIGDLNYKSNILKLTKAYNVKINADYKTIDKQCLSCSSPGKILLCGGYLITNPMYKGLSIAVDSYFTTDIVSIVLTPKSEIVDYEINSNFVKDEAIKNKDSVFINNIKQTNNNLQHSSNVNTTSYDNNNNLKKINDIISNPNNKLNCFINILKIDFEYKVTSINFNKEYKYKFTVEIKVSTIHKHENNIPSIKDFKFKENINNNYDIIDNNNFIYYSVKSSIFMFIALNLKSLINLIDLNSNNNVHCNKSNIFNFKIVGEINLKGDERYYAKASLENSKLKNYNNKKCDKYKSGIGSSSALVSSLSCAIFNSLYNHISNILFNGKSYYNTSNNINSFINNIDNSTYNLSSNISVNTKVNNTSYYVSDDASNYSFNLYNKIYDCKDYSNNKNTNNISINLLAIMCFNALYANSLASFRIGSGFDIITCFKGSNIFQLPDLEIYDKELLGIIELKSFKVVEENELNSFLEKLLNLQCKIIEFIDYFKNDLKSLNNNFNWVNSNNNKILYKIYLLCPYNSGSDTRIMTKCVLDYFKHNGGIETNSQVIDINIINNKIISLFKSLYSNNNDEDYLDIKKENLNLRKKLVELSNLSRVDIEPNKMTEVLDDFNSIEDIFYTIIPGSGGYDGFVVLKKFNSINNKKYNCNYNNFLNDLIKKADKHKLSCYEMNDCNGILIENDNKCFK